MLPESNDIRVIKAASMVLERGIANVVLVGNEKSIKEVAAGIDISGAEIVDPENSDKADEYSNLFYELRKHKGITVEKAKEIMKDPLYWGVMMVKKGDADGMVAGAVYSTSDTLRPALQILKTAPGTKLVSAFFIMVVPDCEYGEKGTFLYADSGLVENPDADQLSKSRYRRLSLLKFCRRSRKSQCFHTCYGSAKSELTEKVIEATRLAKKA